jgi:regulator of sigma E protease
LSLAIAILGLAVLIFAHEAGHFFAARAVGMRPRKFYLGFPPAVIKTTRGGVEYGIGAIPLGGYVKIPGMHRAAAGDLRGSLKPEEQQANAGRLDALDAALTADDEPAALAQALALEPFLPKSRILNEHIDALAPDAYWRQRAWKRIVVIGAGPATNILLALILFTGVYMAGATRITRTVQSVEAGHPAAAAGLRSGDRVLRVAGHPVTADTISTRINATHGRSFTIVVLRAGKQVTIGPLRAHLSQGFYRVGFMIRGVPAPGDSLPTAVGKSFRLAGTVTSLTARSIVGLFHGAGTHNVSSVVGITRDTSAAYRQSLPDFFGELGLISLALALVNLLPVLPLDGGHILMSLLEGVRGRAFSQLAYMRYSAIGVMLFLFLVYFGLRNDLSSLFSNGG